MNKVSIYIPAMKLKVIDVYCAEHKVSRSEVFTNATISFVNQKGKIQCSFCHNPAIGKYQMTVYDPTLGEDEQVKNLCQKCFKQAELEGVAIKEL
jgi:hypothetical protein